MGLHYFKHLLKKNAIIYDFFLFQYSRYLKFRYKKTTHIRDLGKGKIKKEIIGNNNKIEIGDKSYVRNLKILIHGQNNLIRIGERCKFVPECSIWIKGSNCKIIIGDGTTFMYHNHLNATEDNSTIFIGNDCMFANTIIIRTSDDHPIIDIETGKRINLPQDIFIGNHVWVAPHVKIMKGAYIASNCIIGSDTTISKKFDKENCLIIGRHARIVKENVSWLRYLSDYEQKTDHSHFSSPPGS